MTRVVLIDDDLLVEEGIAAMLERAGLEVVAVERDSILGIRAVEESRPDVVLCDVMLDGEPRGFEILRALREGTAATTPVLMLSSFAPSYFVDLARESGAAGYLTKAADPAGLAAAIRCVAAGGRAFPEATIAERRPSPRELEVVRLAASGRSNSEIGGDLGISTRTVEAHLDRLFDRYGVRDRIALTRLALRKGWVVELPGPSACLAQTL